MSYTAIVLNDESHNKLVQLFGAKWLSKTGWKTIAHHTTMHMGPPREDERELVGQFFTVLADAFAEDDKVMAVRVQLPDDSMSDNKVPHITLAVNHENGGKPFMSNKLTGWKSLKDPIILRGRFENVQ